MDEEVTSEIKDPIGHKHTTRRALCDNTDEDDSILAEPLDHETRETILPAGRM